MAYKNLLNRQLLFLKLKIVLKTQNVVFICNQGHLCNIQYIIITIIKKKIHMEHCVIAKTFVVLFNGGVVVIVLFCVYIFSTEIDKNRPFFLPFGSFRFKIHFFE